MAELTPFRVDVPQAVLDDLKLRLAHTRWPEPSPDGGWAYGTELTYLKELCEYWRSEFDWRAAEVRLNRWPQFLTTIDGQQLHFIHARSANPDALPLVITHGWPGSVAEFLEIIDPLIDPGAHGGDPADSFHVVCPSIPGYGFSGPTTAPGWHVRRVAQAVATLMGELGYPRYGAQGGDWGAMVTMNLGDLDPDHLVGIHLNMIVASPPDPSNPMEGVEPDEVGGLTDLGEFMKNETGYQQIQGTKPQTLGYGLADSPAGLAGWIVEKFRTWSDCDGDVESVHSRDALLTNIALYWVTNTITSSARLYYETMKADGFKVMPGRVEVPTGVAVFPKEIYRPPLAWARESFNIQRWTRFDHGGHFAAMEQPAVLIDDVREFFRPLR